MTTLLFPHQLFADSKIISESNHVYLVEDPLYFTQLPFHKQKLVLHRASMQYFASQLTQKGVKLTYIPFHSPHSATQDLFKKLADDGVKKLHYIDPEDYLLERRVRRYASKQKIELSVHPSPNFLTSLDEYETFFEDKEGYLMHSFYIYQRKRLDILVQEEKPEGGKWSFDAENRKKLPKKMSLPSLPLPDNNDFIEEAKEYVQQYFPKNPGQITPFIYPATRKEAKTWLKNFLQQRMESFGKYEDAMHTEEPFIFHSLLTPMLNIGLLQPEDVVTEVLAAHKKQEFPLNSLEGFIRQIIGWREFMRIIYRREGSLQRTSNFWGFTKKMPEALWKGNTGILPVDHVVGKVLERGYAHHIERLMVLGNFMLLTEIAPTAVYEWFMALFIDAYDWVMVPNVYGMSQYADGGLITTKPYLSGSNYIRKMSNYPKGDWCEIWDGLYWRFIFLYQEKFKDNPRMQMMIRLANKMEPKKRDQHIEVAEQFITRLHH